MQQDKRELKRVRFERPARVITRGGEKHSVKSCDFSMNGAAFIAKAPVDVGEVLRLTLNIGVPGQSKIMKIYGQVIHRSKKDNQFLVGIRFNRK